MGNELLQTTTSLGARAMRGSGAVILLRNAVGLCSYLIATSRCPRTLLPLPVVPVPSSARAQISIWSRTVHVQQNCTVVQYKKRKGGHQRTNERTTNEIPFDRKDFKAVQAGDTVKPFCGVPCPLVQAVQAKDRLSEFLKYSVYASTFA